MPAEMTSKSRGRPVFYIDPSRLRGLREEKQLTQSQLSAMAQERLGLPVNSGTVKHYQRIERNGKTSASRAKALAEVLGTTVGVLQGEAPEDEAALFIDRLEKHLAEQIACDANQALVEYMAKSDQSTPRELAEDFARRVESAMFDMHDEELQEIALITGWSVDQLKQPVFFHGHWLISARPSSTVAEVVLGARSVVWYISQDVEAYVKDAHSDTSIVLRESLPKFHVFIKHPRVAPFRLAFSFSQCLPSPTGIQWVKPNWRERLCLDDGLYDWAYSTANFVTGFDGQVRPSDVRRLRLKVDEYDFVQHAWKQVALIKGRLDELPEETLRSFQVEGSSHALALNWIISGGREDIEALLKEWPLDYWEVSAGQRHIRLQLNVPIRLIIAKGQRIDTKYEITLVEELPGGRIQRVPWRTSCVNLACEDLKRFLGRQR